MMENKSIKNKNTIIQIILNSLLENTPDKEIILDKETVLNNISKYDNPYEVFETKGTIGIRIVPKEELGKNIRNTINKLIKKEELNENDQAIISFILELSTDEDLKNILLSILDKSKSEDIRKQIQKQISKHKNN